MPPRHSNVFRAHLQPAVLPARARQQRCCSPEPVHVPESGGAGGSPRSETASTARLRVRRRGYDGDFKNRRDTQAPNRRALSLRSSTGKRAVGGAGRPCDRTHSLPTLRIAWFEAASNCTMSIAIAPPARPYSWRRASPTTARNSSALLHLRPELGGINGRGAGGEAASRRRDCFLTAARAVRCSAGLTCIQEYKERGHMYEGGLWEARGAGPLTGRRAGRRLGTPQIV